MKLLSNNIKTFSHKAGAILSLFCCRAGEQCQSGLPSSPPWPPWTAGWDDDGSWAGQHEASTAGGDVAKEQVPQPQGVQEGVQGEEGQLRGQVLCEE